jgi:Zn-dependent peptidase ImmA (M78 family)
MLPAVFEARVNELRTWSTPLLPPLLTRFGTDSAAEALERFAESLLTSFAERHGPRFGDIPSPLDVEALAAYLGIERERDYESRSHAAQAKLTRGRVLVSVNRRDSYWRRRFSLAHEIAHVCLRRELGPVPRETTRVLRRAVSEEEALCNRLAAALLMPRTDVRRSASSTGGTSQITRACVEKASRDFHVSEGVVVRRYAEVQSLLLLLWSRVPHSRKAASEAAIRVVARHPPYPWFSRWFVPRDITASADRIRPNIVAAAFESAASCSSTIKILGLGSLPNGEYCAHTVFFPEPLQQRFLYQQGHEPSATVALLIRPEFGSMP